MKKEKQWENKEIIYQRERERENISERDGK
jgi:hypothetical protein